MASLLDDIRHGYTDDKEIQHILAHLDSLAATIVSCPKWKQEPKDVLIYNDIEMMRKTIYKWIEIYKGE